MPRNRSPFSYPLRSREAMVQFIVYNSRAGNFCYQNQKYFPLAWNVKLNNFNLEFDHLYKLYVEEHGELNPTQLRAVRDAYNTEYGENKYDATDAQGNNREALFNVGMRQAQDTLTEDSAYSTLADGTSLDVEWTFTGRSGGYASVSKYEGWNFGKYRNDQDFENWLMALDNYQDDRPHFEHDFKFIRTLYKFVVEMSYFLTSEKADRELEYRASDYLFMVEFYPLITEYEDDKVLIHVPI